MAPEEFEAFTFTLGVDQLKQFLLVLPLKAFYEDGMEKVRVSPVVSCAELPQDDEPSP